MELKVEKASHGSFSITGKSFWEDNMKLNVKKKGRENKWTLFLQ